MLSGPGGELDAEGLVFESPLDMRYTHSSVGFTILPFSFRLFYFLLVISSLLFESMCYICQVSSPTINSGS